MTVAVFLLCLAAGLICGAADGALSPLRKRKRVYVTVLADIIIAFVSVALHWTVVYLYTDGRIFVYAVTAQIAGFATGRAAVKALARKLGTHAKNRRKISRNIRCKTRSKHLQV